MAIFNSIELPSSLPFPAPMISIDNAAQHEKKSCCLMSLAPDYLLQLNGLTIQVHVNFPFDHVMTGRVLAVLIHADQISPPELLFLENGSDFSDFLDSKDTLLIGIVE
jgi:hypothetical protein